MPPSFLGKARSAAVSAVVAIAFFIAHTVKYLLLPFAWFIVVVAIVLVVLIFAVPTTPRDVAYRNIDPSSGACGFSIDKAWDVLADPSIDNNEAKAIAKFPTSGWEKKFGCALQRHTIPAANGRPPLSYNLAFVEFKEEGSPYELIKDAGTPYSLEELANQVRYVDGKRREPITQLRAVTKLLRENPGRNYVVTFVHGWRHDARVGDDNVADLRRYAAHAARFLQERCHAGEQEQCNRVVTAVYIGWRGARIDENRVMSPFVVTGTWLDGGVDKCRGAARSVVNKPSDPKCWRDILTGWGSAAASASAALTLFDRKPVSETIAPHVVTALRSIESAFDIEKDGETIPYFDRLNNPNRLLVIGHSLGGNLLATALEHDLVKRVEWQAQRNNDVHVEGKIAAATRQNAAKPNEPQIYFDPPLGNLVVLINPASEARKWTAIQRAVWEKIIFRNGDGKSDEEYLQGHRFFPVYQRPVLVAVTSAFAWPPGGIRAEDCAIAFNFDKEFKDNPPAANAAADARRKMEKRLHEAIASVDEKSGKGGVVYDSATHDLFPFFKLDFRPMADRLDRYGRFLAGQRVPRLSCGGETEAKSWWPWLLIKVAALLRDLPFQESDLEETRTIGNLDVPRHAAGSLEDYLLTSRPFGTTHEIRGGPNSAVTMSYSELAGSSLVACPITDFWLSRARRNQTNGTNWNSRELAAASADENPDAKPLSARISHGFDLAGMQPITRANDPFWNMRAYDDVIAQHSGYKLSSFICAINQLVMDPSTKIPSRPKSMAPPEATRNPAENVTDATPPTVK